MDDPTPFEDRLRSALTAGVEQVDADAGAPVADPPDLARRRVRHDRRRRTGLVAAAAVLLVAAAGGGWALGRDTGGPDVEQVTGPTSTTTTASTAPETETGAGGGPTVEAAPGDLPVVVPEGASGGLVTGPMLSSWTPSTLDARFATSPHPSGPLFTRTLDDGTVLDVRGNVYDSSTYQLPPFWEPPPWCFPSGDVYVGARLPEAVGQAGSVRYAAVEPGTVLVGTSIVGAPEGHPQWLTLAQVPEATTLVRADFPGGGTDEMEPVDGLAVLSAPVADGVDVSDPFTPDAASPLAVAALAADGSELARYDGPWTGASTTAMAPPPDDACAGPDSLPAPGAEQPADPAAAEAAVRDVWDRGFGRPGSLSPDEQMALIDDPTGVAEAQARVTANYTPEQLAEISIPIDDLVFAGPEQAFIEYTVDAGGLGTFADRFAELVLIDGEWKVTRASACSLTNLGGGTCAPLAEG